MILQYHSFPMRPPSFAQPQKVFVLWLGVWGVPSYGPCIARSQPSPEIDQKLTDTRDWEGDRRGILALFAALDSTDVASQAMR